MSNLGAVLLALAILVAGMSMGGGLHHIAESLRLNGSIFINTVRKTASPDGQNQPEENSEENEQSN